MPMIDVYAAARAPSPTRTQLARDLAAAVMTVEQVPDIPMFRDNTAAFVHELPAACDLERQRRQHLRPGPGPHQRRRARPRQAAGGRRPAHLDRGRRGRRSIPRRPHLGPSHRSARRWLGPARARQHERRTRRGGPGADRRAWGEHVAWLTVDQRPKLHGCRGGRCGSWAGSSARRSHPPRSAPTTSVDWRNSRTAASGSAAQVRPQSRQSVVRCWTSASRWPEPRPARGLP